jgi:hypothetical protein
VIKLKPIKPKATAATLKRVEQAVRESYRDAAGELLKDYQKTTATWDTPVRFRVRVGKEAVSVYTDNAIWRYVDQGTRPHVIRPRTAKVLAFAGGYQAKTRVGSIIARAGGPSGGAVFAREVQHPGTKARGFTTRLRSKWIKKWPKMVQAAIDSALR